MSETTRQELLLTLQEARAANVKYADCLRLSRDGGAVLLVLGPTAFVLYSTSPGFEGVINCREPADVDASGLL